MKNFIKHKLRKIHAVFMIAAIGMVGLVSCENGIGGDINLFSINDDVELGQQLHQEILNSPQEYPIYDDPQATAYVQNIADKILDSPEVQYDDEFPYTVTLIDNDSVVNAFATPGGYIYFYTGLLKFMPNEAALAGVVGHEIAHAEERHSTERMTTSYGLSTLLSIILGESPGQIEAMAANLVGGLYLLQHSRSDELESDELSFRYLQDTEYYPAAMEYFFQELGDGDAEFSIEQLLITHPDPDIRLEEIREMARANNVEATSENLFTERYQDFLRTLR